MTQSSLVSSFNSIKLSIDREIRRGLSTLAMSDPTEIEKQLGHIDAVIGIYRDERSKLDTALASLEDMADRLRVANGATPVRGRLDHESLPALPQSGQVSGSVVATARPGGQPTGAQAAGKPDPTYYYIDKVVYYECGECGLYHRIEVQPVHHCRAGYFGLHKHELDRMYKDTEGWINYREYKEDRDTSERASTNQPHVRAVQQGAVHEAARENGIREGSKKHRIYERTTKLLADGPMHVDEIMKNMPVELFEDVQSDKRTNLSNILSQLKTKRLLISDNRGFWSLPITRPEA
jgi:hypothetical protein